MSISRTDESHTRITSFVKKVANDQVIPHVIQADTFPATGATLHVVYPEVRVNDGQVLERTHSLEKPILELDAGVDDPDALYTLIMTDPDLLKTNDTMSGQVRHWIQPGVRFNSTTHQSEITQPAITNYFPPSPGLGTGKHRYVFILAKQTSDLTVPSLTDGGPDADLKSRMRFNTEQYIQKTGLQVVALAYMFVKPDIGGTMTDVQAVAESLVHKLRGL